MGKGEGKGVRVRVRVGADTPACRPWLPPPSWIQRGRRNQVMERLGPPLRPLVACACACACACAYLLCAGRYWKACARHIMLGAPSNNAGCQRRRSQGGPWALMPQCPEPALVGATQDLQPATALTIECDTLGRYWAWDVLAHAGRDDGPGVREAEVVGPLVFWGKKRLCTSFHGMQLMHAVSPPAADSCLAALLKLLVQTRLGQ